MLVIDNKNNKYSVRFYDIYGDDCIEDFLDMCFGKNMANETHEHVFYYDDISELIHCMSDYIHNEGIFIDDKEDKGNAYFVIRSLKR